jgi:alpha-1,2-mannosyltransferase
MVSSPASRGRVGVGSALCCSLVLLAVFAVVRNLHGFSMVDMLVYRAEGAAVADGQDLYAMRLPGWDLAATYPPFAALTFVPATWFDISLLRVLVTLGNVALLALLAHFSFRLVGWPKRDHTAAAILLATGLALFLEPVYTTFQYGQINLLIGCLVLWDLTRSDHNRFKGAGIGLAIGIKLTPGVFTIYLLLTGRLRAAAVSIAVFLATGLLGAVALPTDSYGFWTEHLWDSRRVGVIELVDNQSIRGMIARLLSTNDPGLLASTATALTAVSGFAVAVLAARSGIRRAEAWAVVSVALTAVLVSPISWSHHWIWCVPLLILLCAEAAQEVRVLGGRRRSWRSVRWQSLLTLTALAFCSHLIFAVPKRSGLGIEPYWQPAASLYPLIALAVLALTAVRLRRHSSRVIPVHALPTESVLTK